MDKNIVCNCCGGNVSRISEYKLKCIICGLTFTAPERINSQIFEKYKSAYWERLIGGWKPFIAKLLGISKTSLMEQRALSQFKMIKEYIVSTEEPLSFFEIGTGEGDCIKFFQQKGFKVAGCEPDEYLSKQYGLESCNIICGGVENLKDFKKKFDVIFTSHVLEHLKLPKEAIKTCVNLLNDKGLLFIEVPNCSNNSILAKDIGFWHTHLYNFTSESLRKLLTSCGLKVVAIKSYKIAINYDKMSNIRKIWEFNKLREKTEQEEVVLFKEEDSIHNGEYLRIIAKKL